MRRLILAVLAVGIAIAGLQGAVVLTIGWTAEAPAETASAADAPDERSPSAPSPDAEDHAIHDGLDACCAGELPGWAPPAAGIWRHDVETWSEPGRPRVQVVLGEAVVGWRDASRTDEVLERHGLDEVSRDEVLGFSRVRTDGSVAEAVEALRAEEAVRYADPNVVAETTLTPNDALFPQQSGERMLDVEQAWDQTTGDPSVVVAVLDTGVDLSHADLQPNLLAGNNIVSSGNPPADDVGHGTAVAGLIGAVGDNAEGISGVAPETAVLPVKVADGNGLASVADLATGIRWAADQNADIINISMGMRVHARTLEDAVDYAVQNGSLVVAAAGNENIHYEMYPAFHEDVVSVGGAGGQLGTNAPAPGPIRLAHSTVLSPGVDALAPAEDVVTTYPGDLYGYVHGTSAAAAFASGVAALAKANDPNLTAEQLGQILRQGQREVPGLAPVRTIFPAGRIDAKRAVDRADASYVDAAVFDVEVFPKKPRPGETATIRITVENEGNGPISSMVVKAYENGVEISPDTVSNLAVGERRTVDFPWTPSSARTYTLTGEITPLSGEVETADNERDLVGVDVDASDEEDLRVTSLTISEPDLAIGSVDVEVKAVNAGTDPAASVDLSATVNGTTLGPATVQNVDVGQTASATFTWTIPQTPPDGIILCEGEAAPLPHETTIRDNGASLEFILGQSSSTPVRPLYQQSNSVDVIPDAPARVAPGIDHVPVSLYVASKGDPDPNTRLSFDRVTVDLMPTPTGPNNRVYDDSTGTDIQGIPSRWVQGLEVLDEMGRVQQANGQMDPNIFQDDELRLNGRHTVLRVPRSAFGIASQPAAPAEAYVEVSAEWRTERRLFWIFSVTDSGRHRKVLKLDFAAEPFASLDPDHHYYDVHHHTIAEWTFGSPLDIFAPRKAYGGPIAMIRETAHAMGLIPSPDAVDGAVITTDHSSFYNETINDPDHRNNRPPFGFASVGNSLDPVTGNVRSEFEQYRHLFGLAAGEEVAFKQGQGVPAIPTVPYLDPVLSQITFPIGAHMLAYRGEHVEGPWHGGGWIPNGTNPPAVSEVRLDDTLNRYATQNQTANERAFVYAAHPYSGQGWDPDNLDRILGANPGQRGTDFLHPGTRDFVFKGVQVFNGRHTRSLDSSAIDFRDLNPWTDSTWQAGNPGWDHTLQLGLVDWHERIASMLEWSFDGSPDEVFPRKLYIAGGSDAHGDFNFGTSRLATPLNVQSTFSTNDNHYGSVRTYVVTDGVPGSSRAERRMTAYAEGNTVVTDGPLVVFEMDAEGRFDSSDLAWHDGQSLAEDADGRIGGGGPLDGGRTMLVPKTGEPWFDYVWNNASDLGSNDGKVEAIEIYADRPGVPNPTQNHGSFDELRGVGSLAVGPAGTRTSERVDPNEEGTVDTPVAYSLGAFTGGDPDAGRLPIEERRAYTNPVWAVPIDVQVTIQPDLKAGEIPAGGLTARFEFGMSMDASFAFPVEVKQLDANGDSTDRSVPAIQTMTGTWSSSGSRANDVYEVTNQQAIALGGDAYPDPRHITFVLYSREAPRDPHGNELNPIAVTAETDHPSSGGGTTGGATGSSGGSGGSGGGGACGMPTVGDPGPRAWFPLILLLGLLGIVRFRNRP